MRLSDFILLNEEQKKLIVLHEGTLVAKRSTPPYLVFLFQMDNYYVESYCNVQTKGIEEYRVFQNPVLLTPYLETIAIDDLLE